MSRKPPAPSNAELEILQVLWKKGPSTVRAVQDELPAERDVGYTTVLKTMQLMAEKKLVTRDESARSHVYAAAVAENSVKRRMVADILDRVFEGSAAGLLMHALSEKRASKEDLKAIRELLDAETRRTK